MHCFINPSQNELGKMSKQLLVIISDPDIIEKIQFNQWRNTDAILPTLFILQYWYPVNPGYLRIFNHGSPHLKLVLMLSLATNNPPNIFDTSPSKSAIFCKSQKTIQFIKENSIFHT